MAIKQRDLAFFYGPLADMLEIGIPLLQALLAIRQDVRHRPLVNMIQCLVTQLSRGASLAEALQQQPRIFSDVTWRLIALAHTSEELIAILRYCDQSLRRRTFFSKFLLILLPQVSLTLVLMMILFFLRIQYLPSFYYAVAIFRNATPRTIQVFDALTSITSIHFLLTAGILLIAMLVVRLGVRVSQRPKFIFSFILYYLPMVGSLIAAFERERLALLYTILLGNGTSTQRCAYYSITMIHNLVLKGHAEKMHALIQRGEDFSVALRKCKVFSNVEVQLIALGVVANSLKQTFRRLHHISTRTLERKLLLFLEALRFLSYLFNVGLFLFSIVVAETLFFYPGLH